MHVLHNQKHCFITFLVLTFLYFYIRYFSCPANHGLFAPPHKITKSQKQPKPATSQLSSPVSTAQLPSLDSQNLLQERLQNSTGSLGSNNSVNSQCSVHSNSSLSFKPTVKPQVFYKHVVLKL